MNSFILLCPYMSNVMTRENVKSNFFSDSPRRTTISLSPDVNVKVGQLLTLRCVTDANPVPERYYWYRYNNSKQGDSKIWKHETLNNTLTLSNIQRADEACYACSATNAISTGEKSVPECILVCCKYFGKFGKMVHNMLNSCRSYIQQKYQLTNDLI